SIAVIKAKTDGLPADPASNTQVNTRLATSGYTAPDNASIAAVKAKTDNLPTDLARNTPPNPRLATSRYLAPGDTSSPATTARAPILAAAAGVLSGAGTGTMVVKGGNVSTTRIVASTDHAGNRYAVTLTLPV